MRLLALLPALLMLPIPSLVAQEAVGGAKIYKQAIPSVVWIHSPRSSSLATGSGALIDREARLVLTNYHVVEENPRATVFFPVMRDGSPVPEKKYYTERMSRLGIVGKVIALDKTADLAIIQLRSVPEGVKAIPLAMTSPGPGDTVHSLGNPGKSGALWGYVKGGVRNVYRKKWKAQLDRRTIITFEAKVIETDSATNPGDSGGPLLNDQGELVGVTQGGAVDAQLVSFFIDLSEVKQLLNTRAVQSVRTVPGESKTEPPPPAPMPRQTPLAVADAAKLFDEPTKTALNSSLAELHKKKLDVLIETLPKAPAEWIEKARKGTPADRSQLFREYAEQRLKAEKADGVVILICVDPRYAMVEIPPKLRSRFPDQYATKVADALLAGLKMQKPNDGITAAVKLLSEGLQEAKK